jgi:hypothetical protein
MSSKNHSHLKSNTKEHTNERHKSNAPPTDSFSALTNKRAGPVWLRPPPTPAPTSTGSTSIGCEDDDDDDDEDDDGNDEEEDDEDDVCVVAPPPPPLPLRPRR